jgi:hypothetical protein
VTNTPIHDSTIRSREQTTPNRLTAHDRCDTRACDAQAYVRVHVTPLLELLFCGHHWTEKRAVIGDVFDVQDDTGTITKARDKQ